MILYDTTANVFSIILGFFLVALIIFVLFLSSVLLFLYFSKKLGKRFFPFVYSLILFIVALFIRLGCICAVAVMSQEVNSFSDAIVQGLKILYATGGGLTFEGQDNRLIELNNLATIFYFGSILWLAATYLAIISIGLNYELNSWVRLLIFRIKCKFGRGENEIFIFTAITDDALVLAKSIVEHCKNNGLSYVDFKVIKNDKRKIYNVSGIQISDYEKDIEANLYKHYAIENVKMIANSNMIEILFHQLLEDNEIEEIIKKTVEEIEENKRKDVKIKVVDSSNPSRPATGINNIEKLQISVTGAVIYTKEFVFANNKKPTSKEYECKKYSFDCYDNPESVKPYRGPNGNWWIKDDDTGIKFLPKDGPHHAHPLIIFAGNDIPPYDKEERLHREIMMNNYIYQSFYQGRIADKNKPIISILRFKDSKKHPLRTINGRRIRIFALANDAKEVGYESINSAIAFNDINAILNMEFPNKEYDASLEALMKLCEEGIKSQLDKYNKKHPGKKAPECYIASPKDSYLKYYVLSNSTINYEFYDKKVTEIIMSHFEKELLNKRIYLNNNKVVLVSKNAQRGDELYVDETGYYAINGVRTNTKKNDDPNQVISKKLISPDPSINKEKQEYRKFEITFKDDSASDGKKVEIVETYNRSAELNVLQFFKTIFQTRVINESHLAGEDLILQRQSIEIQSILNNLQLYDGNDVVRKNYIYAINRLKRFKKEEPDPVVDTLKKEYSKYLKNKIKDKNGIGGSINEDISIAKFYEQYYVSHIEEINEGERKFEVLIIGFGQTGQMALNNLYVNSVSIEPSSKSKEVKDKKLERRYIPSRFVAHVFDNNISQSIGVFAQTHPSYLVKKISGNMEEKEGEFFNLMTLLDYYKNDYKGLFYEIDEMLKFPFIYAHDKNCKDMEFLESIDGLTGAIDSSDRITKNFAKIIGKISAIVVALGDDEENINVANALLQGIRQEVYRGGEYYYHTIYVNIRDERNLSRLNWADAIEAVKHSGVFVRPFGCRDRMYSYEYVVEEEESIKANNIYNAIANYMHSEEANTILATYEDEYINELIERLNDPENVDTSIRKKMNGEITYDNVKKQCHDEIHYNIYRRFVNEVLLDKSHQQKILEQIKEKTSERKRGKRDFSILTDYKRRSNKESTKFSPYVVAFVKKMLETHYLGNNNVDDAIVSFNNKKEVWEYLAILEHNRWVRNNIADGFVYSKSFDNEYNRYKNNSVFTIFYDYGFDNPRDYGKGVIKLHQCMIPNSYPDHTYLDITYESFDYAFTAFPALWEIESKKNLEEPISTNKKK